MRTTVEAEERQRDETGEAGAMCLRGACDAERVLASSEGPPAAQL
jgi:hypothetical protein